MKNNYEIRGDITAILLKSSKYGDKETLISTSKLARAMEFPNTYFLLWDPKMNSFYVVGTIYFGNYKKKGIQLHRWMTIAPDGMVVDHNNHDTLDNTDGNLRVITHAENQQNRNGAHKDSKSGIIGVAWNKKDKRWRVALQINGKIKYIGQFVNISEAEAASMEARKKYMPFSKENIA